MSYEKTTWQNGDTITAEKLNKIENGIADFIMNVEVVQEAGSTSRFNKTWKEINDHMTLGGIVILTSIIEDGVSHIYDIQFVVEVVSPIDESESSVYGVVVSRGGRFITDNENGYPVYAETNISNPS